MASLKIKQMFDLITGKKVYPLTTTKAVKDTTTKQSLFDILKVTPIIDESESEVSESVARDADTLGGKPPSAFALSEALADGKIRFRVVDGQVEVSVFEEDE